MEALDLAIKMEQDGQKFYREAAAQLQHKAAQRMLLSLAEDERRHEEIIEGIKASKAMMIESEDFASIKSVFEELVANGEKFVDADDHVTDVLRKGVDMEARSVSLYQDLLSKATQPAEQDIWARLVKEEQKHERLLALTLEYLDQPHMVLETDEFLFYGYDEKS